MAKSEADQAMDQLISAHARATEAIRRVSDPRERFELAGLVADTLRQEYERAAKLRAEVVAQVWERDHASLASLATQFGVSRARADQLLKAASRQPKEQ